MAQENGETCNDDVNEWVKQLTEVTSVDTWALHMVDAWGKLPSGIFSGNLAEPGDFFQCINLRGQMNSTREVKGKYCTAYLLPMTGSDGDQNRNFEIMDAVSYEELAGMLLQGSIPNIGTCFPASCSQTDVQAWWTFQLSPSCCASVLEIALSLLFCSMTRLTPTYIFIIGIMATILPYASTGPVWYSMDSMSDACAHNWWHNMLYVNNLVNYTGKEHGECYGEGWYLANDMQFFLLAPAVIYILWRWNKIGYGMLVGVSLIPIVSTPVVMDKKYEPPTMLIFSDGGNFFNDSS